MSECKAIPFFTRTILNKINRGHRARTSYSFSIALDVVFFCLGQASCANFHQNGGMG